MYVLPSLKFKICHRLLILTELLWLIKPFSHPSENRAKFQKYIIHFGSLKRASLVQYSPKCKGAFDPNYIALGLSTENFFLCKLQITK